MNSKRSPEDIAAQERSFITKFICEFEIALGNLFFCARLAGHNDAARVEHATAWNRLLARLSERELEAREERATADAASVS